MLLIFWTFSPVRAVTPADDAFWYDTTRDGERVIRLHFFWNANCPHCQTARPFIQQLPSTYPWIEVVNHPLHNNRMEIALYLQAARSLGQEANSIPGFMFCRQLMTGYHTETTTGKRLINRMKSCRRSLQEGESPTGLRRPEPAVSTARHCFDLCLDLRHPQAEQV